MRVYLDHNATSPLTPKARAAMFAVLDEQANPSSVHREGQRARAVVEGARETLMAGIGAPGGGLVFTGSGTEACQLAILGAARAMGVERLLVSAIEHSAVLDAAAASGLKVSRIGVLADGTVDLDGLARLLDVHDGEKMLVAVMAANNETGVIQPVRDVTSLAASHGAVVFCDAIQALGRVPFDVAALGVGLAAFCAHKIGGPQGIGALYAAPGIEIAPLMPGRQERGLRGGTENVAAIAGFAAALDHDGGAASRVAALRERIESTVRALTPDAVIVGASSPRLGNTSAIALPGALAETLVMALDLEGIAVSAGAACSSGKVGASHVLAAMRPGPEIEKGTIRVSLGWSTTDADVDTFATAWERVALRVREHAVT